MVTDTPQLGQARIPGYTILKEIGRGGVATVYLAIQESLKREVALKIMSPALAAEPNFTERFIREGRTIAQLTHPGIVTIYDISVANYQHYIAMEYLGGGSLKQRMQKPVASAPALAVLRQVAAALGYAHSKGFVHRDVKPENIIFRDPSKPVLTDFGIAKQTSDSESHLTSVGVIVGTPRYMSPEQADGRGTDPRSDIYALGVLLYEMLVGQPPYDAKESIALLYSHINDPIPTLPEQLTSLQPLINDLLAKDPEQRLQNCEAVVERIRRTQKDMRDSERAITPPPVGVRVSKSRNTTLKVRPKRDRVVRGAGWVGAGLAVLLVVVAVLRGLTGTEETSNDASEVDSANVSPPAATLVDLPEPQPSPTAPPSAKPRTSLPVPEPRPPQRGSTAKSQTPQATTVVQRATDNSLPAPVAGPPDETKLTADPPGTKINDPPADTAQATNYGQAAAPRRPADEATAPTSANIVTPEVVTPTPSVVPPVTSVSVTPAVSVSRLSTDPDERTVRQAAAPQTLPVEKVEQKTRSDTQSTATTKAKARASRGWVLASDEKISDLLASAQQQFDNDKLAHPPGDNALETYRLVLRSAPDNRQAKQGLQRIAARYLRLAKQLSAQKKYTNAQVYIERGLSAIPEHAELRALKIQIDDRARAEKDFAAAEKYFSGKGLSKDRKQAVKLYLAAADKGHVTAQFHLAVAYGNGNGVEINEREALRWLQVAAAQGSFDAQYNLGLGLIFGPKPDPQAAGRWITALAERNYKPAFRLLGWMYTTGTGIEHSISKSVRWVAKGIISNPLGPPLTPDWVVTRWQQRFDAAFERDVNEPSSEEVD